MRIFIWAEFDRVGYNQAALITSFVAAQEKGSALLGLVSNPTSALEGFDVNLISATPNAWDLCQNCGTWLFADIPTLYDPCTCEQSPNNSGVLTDNISELAVNGKLIQSQTLTASGTTQPQTTTNMSSSDEESSNFSWNDGVELVNDAGKFFKATSDLVDAIQSAQSSDADNSKETLNNQTQWTASGWTTTPATQEAESLKEFNIPEFLKVIPKVGPWLTALDALIAGGKKNNTSNTSQTGSVTQIEYSGQLELESDVKGASFFTPGSEYENLINWNASKAPVYDHILGTFNLIEKPTLEYVTYQPEDATPDDYQCVNSIGQSIYFVLPPIRQYRLRPIKYAVNPASELELVDLDVAIQYRLNTSAAVDTAQIGSNFAPVPTNQLGLLGPVAIGSSLGQSIYDDLSYVERLREYGLDIDFWPKVNGTKPNDIGKITYTTGFFPAQCEDMQSVFIAMPDGNTPIFASYKSTPTLTLKVRAILRRTDSEATSTTEDVIFMATYSVKVESISEEGTYEISPMSASPSICSNLPTQTYLKDYVVTGFTSSQVNQAYFPLGNNGLPFDLTLDGINYGSYPAGNPSATALSSITILNSDVMQYPGGVIQTPFGPVVEPPGNPVIFRAGHQIDTESTDLGAGVLLETGLPDRFNGCDADPMPSPASQTEIKDVCSDPTIYMPVLNTRLRNPIGRDQEGLSLTAHPTPFTASVTLRYTLPEQAEATLILYDALGRPARTLLSGELTKAGPQELLVPAHDLPAGLYHAVLQAGEARASVKVVKQ